MCSVSEGGQVNCPNGEPLGFDQKCHDTCSKSKYFMAISSDLYVDNNKCSKIPFDDFSKISTGTEESEDFKEYCLDGETCESGSSTVSFKQCYSKYW